MQRVKSILFDAGWMRYGWPERVGGLGGSPMLRTELGAALAGPRPGRSRALLAHRGARPDAHRLRAARARGRGRPPPALGRGDVVPGVLGTGHRQRPRRAELPRGARRRRRATASAWVINGQKVWTSLAQYSDRCVLLTRTGTAGVAPPRDHRVLRRHGHARDHGRADRDDQRRARVRRGVLRRRRRARRPDPRRGRTAAGRSR